MSNAMRFGKRTLAGVAAGALTASLIPFLAASPAQAAEPTGTLSPVRVSTTNTVLDQVPYAQLSWVNPTAQIGTGDTVSVALTVAPSSTAKITVANKNVSTDGSAAVFTDSTQIAQTSTLSTRQVSTGVILNPSAATAINGTAIAGLAVNEPGTYAGVLTVHKSSVATDFIAFSFTTRGKPSQMTLTPATQTTAVQGVALVTATLKDSNGNITQPAVGDNVSLATNGGTTDPTAGAGALTTALLATGEADVIYTAPSTAGTYTITATPRGTLPGSGVTTQTATVTASGSISPTALSGYSVTVPSGAVATGTTAPNFTADVPAGTSSVTVKVTGGTPATKVRLGAFGSTASGTINGLAAGTSVATTVAFQDVTLDALGAGTATWTIGGGLLVSTASITVFQATAGNAQIGTNNINIVQKVGEITAATISVSPGGAVVAKLGTTTSVTVTVEDQFGAPQPGVVVRAYRGASTSSPAPQLSQATTDAAGKAVVTVSGATGIVTGTTEQYSFSATATGATPVNKNNALAIQYTTDGTVTALSVDVTGTSVTTPVSNSVPTVTVAPYIVVPSRGAISTQGTGSYNLATGVTTVGNSGNYVTLTPTATPGNAVTVTTPEGVFVTDENDTAWNEGVRSLVTNNGVGVNIFGTKTGTHDVTLTSGSISVVVKVRIGNAATDAYNIKVTPETQKVSLGGFTTATVTVTDVFGNPVPGTSATDQGVTVTASGGVLLGGQVLSQTVGTGLDGTATITVLAGTTPAMAKLTAVPATTAVTWANAQAPRAPWASAGFVPPTGAPAPVKSAEATVEVTAAAAKSITITGSRTTVSGKPGIKIDGAVTGIENGKTVVPYFRFPGETTFAQGTARPVIEGGKFTWQRKTGKKFYAYVTSDDGAIKSNRVIIPAN